MPDENGATTGPEKVLICVGVCCCLSMVGCCCFTPCVAAPLIAAVDGGAAMNAQQAPGQVDMTPTGTQEPVTDTV